MIRALLLFMFSVSSFLIPKVFAQTIAGGEVYYELISAKKYKVTAHVYRMCDKSSLNSLSANVYGGSIVVPMNFTRIAISKINDTCGNPCNIQNSVSNPGFEKHTFIDTVDFNYAPYDVFVSNSICIVNFGIKKSGRSSALTTHNSGMFYLDASTNICLSNIVKNISPQFSMEPKFMMACNIPLTYSPGLLDTMDNDSINFVLEDVQSDYNTSVTYNGSFTSQIPMTPFCVPSSVVNCKPLPNAKPPRGFYFDPQNGMTILTPTNCNEVGTIKYKINEFRYNLQKQTYEWLGYVTREMRVQVVVLSNNSPPQIPTTNAFSLCEGNKICFTVKSTDTKATGQTMDDTTSIFWDKGIKDATFRIIDPTAREKAGEFCWQTKKVVNKRVEANFFTVAAYDKKCNVNLVTKTFKVTVVPKPEYTYTNTIGKCGKVKWTFAVYDSFYKVYNITSLTSVKSFQTNKLLYASAGLNDSGVINENGKMIIEHTIKYNNGFQYNCELYVVDTLTMNGAIELPDVNDNRDSVICMNNSASFNFKAGGVKNLKAYKWYLNDSLINQTDTNMLLKISKDTKIKLRVENTGGCFADRVVTYNLKRHQAISSVNKSFCIGDLATVKANLQNMKTPIVYQWKINGVDTIGVDSILNFKINKDTKVQLSIDDADKCPFTDSVLYKVRPAVKFKLGYSAMVCKDSSTTVFADGIVGFKPYVFYWQMNGKDLIVNDSFLKLKADKNIKINLKIKDKNDCLYNDSTYKDSAFIQAIKTPEVSLIHQINACYNSMVNIIPTINNRPVQISYLWTFNKAILGTDSLLKLRSISSQLIKLKVSNSLNCSTEDTVNVFVYPHVPLAINHKTNYHPSSFIILSTTQSYSSYQWFNGKTTANDSFLASDLGLPGKYKIWCKVKDAYGCEQADTVEINTDQFLSVNPLNMQALKIYPNPVSAILTVTVFQNTEIDLYAMDGKFLVHYTLKEGENQIDLTDFASGFYLIKATDEAGQSSIYKIVKQ